MKNSWRPLCVWREASLGPYFCFRLGAPLLSSCVMLIIMLWERFLDSEETRYSMSYSMQARDWLNYVTTEKEFLVIVYAFDKFRSYLTRTNVIFYIIHSSIKYLISKKDAKLKLIRWDHLLQKFDWRSRIGRARRIKYPTISHGWRIRGMQVIQRWVMNLSRMNNSI